MALKDEWKKAGTGVGHAFKDLGKAFVSTAKVAIRETDKWANGDDKKDEENKDGKADN